MSFHWMLAASAGPELTAQIVTTILAFFIVMAILKAKVWGPILKAIDERRDAIAGEFADMERKQAELSAKMKDYEERLRLIDNEARDRMNKSIEEGRRTAAEIVDQAKKAAEDARERSKAEIRTEVEKARVELRNEVVRLSIGAAQKLIKSELNDERHRALVLDFISEVEQRKAS